MPHHFTKNTVEARFWCNKCGKDTMHTVSDGRRGHCKVCHPDGPPKWEKPKPVEDKQESLWKD